MVAEHVGISYVIQECTFNQMPSDFKWSPLSHTELLYKCRFISELCAASLSYQSISISVTFLKLIIGSLTPICPADIHLQVGKDCEKKENDNAD